MEKLYKAIDKAGGKFNRNSLTFTIEQYEEGKKLLDKGLIDQFFEILMQQESKR